MDTLSAPSANTWHHTARPVRLFLIDGRALLPLVVWLVHITTTTFCIAVAACLLFGALEYAKLPLPMLWRTIRSAYTGRIRPAAPPPRLFP